MRLRHGRGDRGWRRQEEIAQPVDDGKYLGGLLVAEAPRGEWQCNAAARKAASVVKAAAISAIKRKPPPPPVSSWGWPTQRILRNSRRA